MIQNLCTAPLTHHQSTEINQEGCLETGMLLVWLSQSPLCSALLAAPGLGWSLSFQVAYKRENTALKILPRDCVYILGVTDARPHHHEPMCVAKAGRSSARQELPQQPM